jgi:hypothetical protein
VSFALTVNDPAGLADAITHAEILVTGTDDAGLTDSVSTGSTYYVAATGNDSNDGRSTAAPWLTIAKVNAATLGAGDAVLFRGGDVFTGEVQVFASPGTAAHPITFGSYGTGRATISNSTGHGFNIYEVAGVAVRDLILAGSGTATANKLGIGLYKDTPGRADYVLIDNVDVTGFQYGISVGAAGGGGYSNVTISNCTAHGNRDAGVFSWGPTFNPASPTYAHTNITVTGTAAYNNLGNSANTTGNSGNGIVLASVDGGTVTLCRAYGNGSANAAASEGPVGIWAYDATNVVISRSVAYGNRTGTTADGGGFDLDINVSASRIEYCLAYGNDGTGFMIFGASGTATNTGNVIRHNLSWGNAIKNGSYGELGLYGAAVNAAIYHNTAVSVTTGSQQPPAFAQLGGTPTGGTVRNNILVARSTGSAVRVDTTGLTASNLLLQGNDYYSTGSLGITWATTTYTTLAAWRAAVSGQEVVSGSNTGQTVDPMLASPATSPTVTDPADTSGASGLRLQAGSPMAASGLNLTALFGVNVGSRDYFGTALTSPPSVGAATGIGTAAATLTGTGTLTVTGTATVGPGTTITDPAGLTDSLTHADILVTGSDDAGLVDGVTAGLATARASILRGVNSSGGEFGTKPGTYGADYHYDSLQSLQYLYSRGHRTVRFQFSWERIQRTLGAALDSGELARIGAFIADAASAGLGVILDVHNGGGYNDVKIGAVGGPTQAQFVDLWTRLSTAFAGNPAVVAYGLMNEPNGLPAATPTSQPNRVSTTYSTWLPDDGNPTLTVTTFGGATVMQGVRGTQNYNGFQSPYFAVTPGEVLTVLADVYPATRAGRSRVRMEYKDSGGTILGPAQFSSNPTISAGTWSTDSMTVTVPATAATVKMSVYLDDQTTAGDTWYVKNTYVVHLPPLWQALSQAAVNGIRANGDGKLIMVGGDSWSGVADWAINNPTGWITDPASNFMYEGHHYWDKDHPGVYADTYSTEVATSVSRGWTASGYPDALTRQVLTELANWHAWLVANGNARGFVGEVGWPRNSDIHTGDYGLWNALGEAWYAAADAYELSVAYWSTGEWWGTYILAPYDTSSGVLAIPNSQAPVIEAHTQAGVLANLTVDASSPAAVASSGTSVTTASFTPPVGSLLVALVSVGNPARTTGTPATGTVTSSGLTWVLKQRQNDQAGGYGGAEVWIADAPGTAAARTVTATSAMPGVQLQVLVFTSARSVTAQGGASAGGSLSSGQLPITPTAPGSYVVGAFCDVASAHALTPIATTTALLTTQDTTNAATFSAWRSTYPAATTTATSYGFGETTGSLWELAALEVLEVSGGAGAATLTATGTLVVAVGAGPTSAGAATLAATGILSTQGGAGVATVTATKFPNAGMIRVNLDFTASTVAATATVTAYLVDGTSYVLRGGNAVTLSGKIGIIDDFEAPLDIAVSYTAQANGGDFGSTGNITLGSSEAFGGPTSWLKDPAVPSRNVPVQLTGNLELAYPARMGVFDVIGKQNAVAVAGVRSGARFRVVLATLNPASIDDLRTILLSGNVLLLQTPYGYRLGNLYLAVNDIAETYPTRILRLSARYWQLDCVAVDRPTGSAAAVLNTWADATATWGTWGNMATVTWLTVMQGIDPNASGANTYVDPVYGGTVL